MSKLLLSGLGVAGLVVMAGCSSNPQACVNPADIQHPDGATANIEQMIAGKFADQQFMIEVYDYMFCVEGPNMGKQRSAEEVTASSDFMVIHIDRFHNTARAFGEQVTAFKAARRQAD